MLAFGSYNPPGGEVCDPYNHSTDQLSVICHSAQPSAPSLIGISIERPSTGDNCNFQEGFPILRGVDICKEEDESCVSPNWESPQSTILATVSINAPVRRAQKEKMNLLSPLIGTRYLPIADVQVASSFIRADNTENLLTILI